MAKQINDSWAAEQLIVSKIRALINDSQRDIPEGVLLDMISIERDRAAALLPFRVAAMLEMSRGGEWWRDILELAGDTINHMAHKKPEPGPKSPKPPENPKQPIKPGSDPPPSGGGDSPP